MKYFLLFLISFACIQAYAQDKIHKKDKSIITCKVVEIGIEEIKYKESEESSDLLIAISTSDVLKVILESGRTIEFSNPLNDIDSYTEDRKKAIKLHFLSPMMEHLAFSYERIVKPGHSIESTVGLIGLGINTYPEERSTGIHVGLGYKFMRTPDFYSSKFKYAHIMKGGYVKPQILFSAYNNTYDDYFYFGHSFEEERDIVAVAFLLNFGKQIVFNNAFLIDYSVGLGYGFTNQDSYVNEDYVRFKVDHYGFLILGDGVPLSVSFNLKIGLLLKQKGGN